MKAEFRACVILTSLGFAFYAIPTATCSADTATEMAIADRLARLHAAQDEGSVRIEIVGQLLEKVGAVRESGARTAQWLQTFNQRFSDKGTPG